MFQLAFGRTRLGYDLDHVLETRRRRRSCDRMFGICSAPVVPQDVKPAGDEQRGVSIE
jgi:hypothetical protein